MRFGIVRPPTTAAIEDHRDLIAAMRAVGLERGEVDHGSVGRGLGIVVWELGMRADPAVTRYFSVGERLFAGSAVIYAVDGRGETVDLLRLPPVALYASARAVELAIVAGAVLRPHTAINDVVKWQWSADMPGPWPSRRNGGSSVDYSSPRRDR